MLLTNSKARDMHEGMQGMWKAGIWMFLLVHQGFYVGAQDAVSPCDVLEMYRSRPGPTYNDPSSSFVNATAKDCCNRCEDDPKCMSWSWQIDKRACGLRDHIPMLRNDTRFHSGVIGGEQVEGNVPVARCSVKKGVRYSGKVLETIKKVRGARMCCNMCEANRDCFSWHWVKKKKRCVLNSDVPSRKKDKASFGGTIF